MRNIQQKEIWFARFPLEEDESKTLNRPVLVVHSRNDEYLVVKVTKHEPRNNDKFDVNLKNLQHFLEFRLTICSVMLKISP